jgi:hypothetical protein
MGSTTWVNALIQREYSGGEDENELHRHETPGWGGQFSLFKRAALVATRIWKYNQRG